MLSVVGNFYPCNATLLDVTILCMKRLAIMTCSIMDINATLTIMTLNIRDLIVT
jgi:hypothetical protein